MVLSESEAVRSIIAERLRGGGYSYACESLPQAARNARRVYRARRRWAMLERRGLVRLRVEPDDDSSWDDIAGDTYDVALNASTVPGGARTIRAEQKRFQEKIEREGVWGVIAEWRPSRSAEWVCGDSCWGIDDHEYAQSGEVADDVMGTAVDDLRAAAKDRCPACRRPR